MGASCGKCCGNTKLDFDQLVAEAIKLESLFKKINLLDLVVLIIELDFKDLDSEKNKENLLQIIKIVISKGNENGIAETRKEKAISDLVISIIGQVRKEEPKDDLQKLIKGLVATAI